MRGLQYQPINFALAAGLNTKQDPRAKQAPFLDIATDVQFDQLGGLQTRLPYAGMSTAILGGGAITEPRRLAVNGDELLLFTKDELYTWIAEASAWSPKATHLAVAMDEAAVFTGTGEQTDPDRAELANVVVFAWSRAGSVWIAARDKTTGATILTPANPSPGSGTSGSRARLVALATKILLFWVDQDGDLVVLALDPANLAASVAATRTLLISSPGYNGSFDVTRVLGADTAVLACCSSPNTSYRISTITAALAITTATKARTASAIALSSAPGGNNLVQVCRANVATLQGDMIDVSTMTDVYTAQTIGTIGGSHTINQIACAHRSVTDGGAYRCYVWWDDGQNPDSAFALKSNWVDTLNGLGAQAAFVYNVGAASRAFDYNGQVYLWVVYAMTSGSETGTTFRSQLQNSYFLYRDDAFLTAKACPFNAGGYPASSNRLPGVQLVDGVTGFAWCGINRRVIPLSTFSKGYAAGAPREITFTFDSNAARRCVRLGRTLYLAGGEVLQYDGAGLYEVGFHVWPGGLGITPQTTGGALTDGTYAWKPTYRWDNGVGERDRSTAVAVGEATITGGITGSADMDMFTLTVTHKTNTPPAIEVWRSLSNPEQDSPFYLITSSDPTVVAGLNRYIPNDPTRGDLAAIVTDGYTDNHAGRCEPNPENESVLESVAPPAARIIVANQDRLFLAGLPGAPNTVLYSRLRNAGEVASFNDALAFDVPAIGGAITALAFLAESFVVFCERAVYSVPGTGNDNTGGGQNFGPAQLVATDVGALSAEAVTLTPAGLIFKSLKGWYLLGQGGQLQYIGDKVDAYDAEAIVAIDVLESTHQIRAVSAERVLLFDYVAGQWATWSEAGALDAAIWRGTYVLLGASGPEIELADFDAGVDYGMDVETSWIKLADLQGFGRVRRVMVLGEFRSPCRVRVRVARNYRGDGAGGWVYFDDRTWTPDEVVGSKLQVRLSPSQQQCEAIKVRITVLPPLSGPLGEAVRLTGLALEVGMKGPLYGRLPATAKE